MEFAHVQLTGKTEDDSLKLTIDGAEISKAVLARGFRIEPHPALPGKFYVHMVVRADLDVDLPDAVLKAVERGADESGAEEESPFEGQLARLEKVTQDLKREIEQGRKDMNRQTAQRSRTGR